MSGKRGNGEGSIFKRKDGSWCGVVTNGRESNGKLKRVYYYGKTRQEVADKIVKVQNEIKTGIFVEPTKMKVGEWFDIWLNDYMKPKLRQTTYGSYEYLMRVHVKPTIGNTLLRDLRPEHLQKMYNEKHASGRHDKEGGLSSRSVRYIHIIIHGALEQAVKNSLLYRNVSEATTLPRQSKKDIRVFSIEEQYKFLNVLEGERLGPAFKLDLATGLRLGELIALRWSDINLEEKRLLVRRSLSRVKVFDDPETKTTLIFQEPKTKSGRRIIPLSNSIVQILKVHQQTQEDEKNFAGTAYEDNGLVFCTELGKPIEPRNMMRKFYTLVDNAKIEKTNFHALRHAFSTRALENGMNPKVLQEILEHSSITMTMDIYSHAMPDFKKSAIENMDYLFDGSRPPEKDKGEKDEVKAESEKEAKCRPRRKEKAKVMSLDI